MDLQFIIILHHGKDFQQMLQWQNGSNFFYLKISCFAIFFRF